MRLGTKAAFFMRMEWIKRMNSVSLMKAAVNPTPAFLGTAVENRRPRKGKRRSAWDIPVR
jgi:hypothetical protein